MNYLYTVLYRIVTKEKIWRDSSFLFYMYMALFLWCGTDLFRSSVDVGGGDLREWSLSFLRSPVEFTADSESGRVSRVKMEINTLQVSNHIHVDLPAYFVVITVN